MATADPSKSSKEVVRMKNELKAGIIVLLAVGFLPASGFCTDLNQELLSTVKQ